MRANEATNEALATPPPGRLPRWYGLAVFCGTLLLYLANGREIGTDDTEPTTLLIQTLIDGDGVVLDRFSPILVSPRGTVAQYLALKRGHVVSRYPVLPAILSVPAVYPQRLFMDTFRRGWRSIPAAEMRHSYGMAKGAAAFLCALSAGLLPGLLWQLGLRRQVGWVVLAYALGSPLWSTASQALWQHGPGVLLFVVALRALAVPAPGRWRVLIGGLAAGGMVACRLLELVFVLGMAAWLVGRHPRKLPWFLVGFVPIVAAVLACNQYWFGTLLGGQAELEALHEETHGVAGAFTWNPLPGLLGTLLSPSRGLFVFLPWVPLALLALPVTWQRLKALPLVPWVLATLLPYLLILSCYTVWWAGFSYGPRYWSDALPLFALVLAAALNVPLGRLGWLRWGLVLSVLVSAAIHALGAWCYPSTWNLVPNSVDRHHERLWDWKDSEITRCIHEKLLGERSHQ